jgi:hypothetical protein
MLGADCAGSRPIGGCARVAIVAVAQRAYEHGKQDAARQLVAGSLINKQCFVSGGRGELITTKMQAPTRNTEDLHSNFPFMVFLRLVYGVAGQFARGVVVIGPCGVAIADEGENEDTSSRSLGGQASTTRE